MKFDSLAGQQQWGRDLDALLLGRTVCVQGWTIGDVLMMLDDAALRANEVILSVNGASGLAEMRLR